MGLKVVAIISALMGVAAVMMFITVPISGLLVGIIGVILDSVFGSGWKNYPLLDWAPFAITYFIYCGATVTFVLSFMRKSDRQSPPPQNEKGRSAVFGFRLPGALFRGTPLPPNKR